MSEGMVKVLGEVAVALSPVLIALLGIVAQKVAGLISAKTKSELARSLLLRLDHAVFSVVKELQQVVVEEFKKASADGKLTDAEKAQIRQVALDKLKSFVSFTELGKLLSIADVEGFVASRVEAAVHDLKRDELLVNPPAG